MDEPADSALPPVLLSVGEAARALRIGRTSLYKLLADGTLRSVRIGRRRLIDPSDVDRFIFAHREPVYLGLTAEFAAELRDLAERAPSQALADALIGLAEERGQ